MTVRDAMNSPVITLRETDSVLAGLKALVQHGINGAPVLSSDARLVGIVTEFDLLLAIDYVGDEVPISRVMHKEVISVQPDTTLDEARHLILDHHYRALPVIENDKVIGVVARRDILRVHFGL